MAIEDTERPIVSETEMRWGSDLVARVIRDLGIKYIALNPGASYRGLHDSLVNYLGNHDPQMILTLHDEHAVAVAHGYAKVTGQPMAVALHSNVGLMHASMAIFNAFCDRVPVLMFGGTGPMDANQRRPWIDWLHTTADQASLIRPFTKWDDQPVSPEAAVRSIARAYRLAVSQPSAPTYICLDYALQEGPLPDGFTLPGLGGMTAPPPALPDPSQVSEALGHLKRAERPLILLGRVSRDEQDWASRVALAEALNAVVLTHQEFPAAFPSGHPLHVLPLTSHRVAEAQRLVREADVILSLGWLDLDGTLREAGTSRERATIISATNDQYLHGAWSKEHFEFPLTTIDIVTEPDAAVRALLGAVDAGPGTYAPVRAEPWAHAEPLEPAPRDVLSYGWAADALQEAAGDREMTLVRVPNGWAYCRTPIAGPLDYLGNDGGEGLGSGPGLAVGAALGLRGSGRVPVAVIGDGDFCMGANALWTAAHYSLPMLVIVLNNATYLNDEVHQNNIAKRRGRPAENAWIGQHMEGPPVDLAGMARAQGLVGIGPVTG
ncbi:MAG: thiamine pyrophosphate-binding protein, partial [Trebonia sp.]